MPPSIIASPLPETRPKADPDSRWIGYTRKNTVRSSVLGCTLPETRARVDLESRWIGYPLEEDGRALCRFSTVPRRRHGRGRTRSPAGGLDFQISRKKKIPIDLRVVGAKMEGGFRAREVYVREGTLSKIPVH